MQLDDVLITDELMRRTARPPDYQAEALALRELAEELTTNPRGLLQKVAETVMTLCRADSAGIAILEPGGAHGILRWHAAAGAFAANLGGTIPRETSACDHVLSRNEVLLFDRAERHFAALRDLAPPLFEHLLAPLAVDGAPIGTLWAIGHTPDRHFDQEDARLIVSFARVAAAAWHRVIARGEAVEEAIDRRTPELAAANVRLRHAEERLQRAISIQTVGVIFFTLDGRITDANAAFEHMSGYTRDELRRLAHWEVLTSPEFLDVTRRAAAEVTERGDTAPYEKQMIRNDGSRWWGLFAPKRLAEGGSDSEGVEFVLDITDRKRAEEELRNRTEQVEQLLAHAPLGVYLVDADFRIAHVNPISRSVFGAISDLIGHDFDDVMHRLWDKAYADEIVRLFRRTLETGEPYVTTERAEIRIDRGVTEFYEWQVHRIPLPGGRPGVVCYFRDISQHVHARAALRQAHEELEARVRQRTAELARANAALERELHERREAEAQINALMKQLVTVQEAERRRIARDLHDHLGQEMTALRMTLEALRSASGARSMAAAATRAERLAEELDRSIDYLTWQLSPLSLEHLGLGVALGSLVRGWSERCRIAAEYRADGVDDLRLPPEVEANLYRVAEEALHNVHKHAHARRVWVALGQRDGRATLVIEDDGHGFHPSDLPASPSGGPLGLVEMRQRATLVGGELEVTSSPGNGTTIQVRVPLSQNG